jgi:Ca2+-binding RTX toxin-like protein
MSVEYGGNGDQILKGSAGADVLYGGEGNDGLSGLEAPDFLYGGTGNDNLGGAPTTTSSMARWATTG